MCGVCIDVGMFENVCGRAVQLIVHLRTRAHVHKAFMCAHIATVHTLVRVCMCVCVCVCVCVCECVCVCVCVRA